MIYAVQPVAGGPIKIGTNEDLPVRLAQLEAHYRQPLAVLATFPGSYAEERALHERFAHLRFGRTEQFRPAADLMEFLGRPLLVGANPEAVEVIPTGIPVRIDRGIVSKAKIVASDRGVDLSAYVAEVMRATVDRDWARIVKRLDSAEGEA